MSDWPYELKQHAEGDITTLCHCWRVTRKDETSLGFTDHDRLLEFDNCRFNPETGMSASEARKSSGLGSDGLDIEGALSADAITQEDINEGLYDGARVETWLVNWMQPEQRVLLRSTMIGNIKTVDGRIIAELQSLSAALDKPTGYFVRRACSAELGDIDCGVDLSSSQMHETATITGIEMPVNVIVAGVSAQPDAYENGWLEIILDGQEPVRIRIRSQVRSGETDHLRLEDPVPGNISVLDEVKLIAGCNKAFSTCRDRFFNAANFRGFPHLPGNDTAFGYVTEDLPVDGKPIIP